jgi:hypothetical protein
LAASSIACLKVGQLAEVIVCVGLLKLFEDTPQTTFAPSAIAFITAVFD